MSSDNSFETDSIFNHSQLYNYIKEENHYGNK